MTVAAMQAVALRDLLRGGSVPTSRKCFRRIAKVIDITTGRSSGLRLAIRSVSLRRFGLKRRDGAEKNPDPRVIGVVSGEEYDSAFPSGEWGNVVAGGPGFTNLISWRMTNWPL